VYIITSYLQTAYIYIYLITLLLKCVCVCVCATTQRLIMTKTRFLGDNDNLQSAAIRHGRLLIARRCNASDSGMRRANTSVDKHKEATTKRLGRRSSSQRYSSTRVDTAAERPVKSVCISALSDFFAIIVIHWYQEHRRSTLLAVFRGIDLVRYQPRILIEYVHFVYNIWKTLK